jgi:hypothetical protein
MKSESLIFRDARPILDVVSYGRSGPKGTVGLSAGLLAGTGRKVRRLPEVMVRVLPKDSNDLPSVGRHHNYIGRHGNPELETDDGERVQGKDDRPAPTRRPGSRSRPRPEGATSLSAGFHFIVPVMGSERAGRDADHHLGG